MKEVAPLRSFNSVVAVLDMEGKRANPFSLQKCSVCEATHLASPLQRDTNWVCKAHICLMQPS